jgi:hypothetical protein
LSVTAYYLTGLPLLRYRRPFDVLV